MVGDLTALYDLSAPWALRSHPLPKFHLVILNNGGGKIFQPMFNQRLFENRHEIEFQRWAEMWRQPYQRWDGAGEPGHGVVEIRPDPEQTEAVLKRW